MIDSFKTLRNILLKELVHNRKYQQAGIILLTILLSMYIAYRGYDRYTGLVLFALVGAGAFGIFVRTPAMGLVALAVLGMIVPFEIGTGTNSAINASVMIAVALLVLWFATMLVKNKQINLVATSINAPLLGFGLVSLLAFLSGQLPWFKFAQSAPIRSQIGGLIIFLLSLGVFLVVINQLDKISWLQWIFWGFVFVGSIYLLARIVPSVGNILNKYRIFQSGGLGSLFWVWIVSLAFSQFAINKDLKFFQRVFLAACVSAAMYIGLVQSYSWKSGWIPPLISIAIIGWVGFPKLRIPLFFSAIAAVFVYFSTTERLVIGSEDYSVLTRFEAWKILVEIIKVNPILGLGPANYYFYTPLFSILGYYVQFNSHNNYIDIVAQTGILGLICFLWFAWAVWKVGWRLKDQKNLDGFSRAYAIGALGGLVGTLVSGMLGDWIIPFVYNIGFNGFRASVLGWLFLGGLVALDKIVNKKSEAI